MTARALPLCTAALLLLSSCTDRERHPTAPDAAPLRPAISDAARGGGNRHFSFLPPMLPAAPIHAEFDPAVSPRVEICEGSDCARIIAWAELGGGDRLDAVRRVPEDEHYIVNWHTGPFDLDARKTYRVQVRVAGTRLGFADVDVVEKAREIRDVPTGFVPLLRGSTLPIKFRIEKGAVVVVSGGAGGTVVAGGGSVTLALPPGAVEGEVGITVEPVALDPASPQAAGVVPGTAYEFGPHGIQFEEPVTMTIRYDPAKLPPGVGQNALRLHRLVDGRWIPLAQSRVDVRTGTVSGVTHSFSTYGVLASSSVSAGEYFACGIGTSGSTYCWGSDQIGQLGDAATNEAGGRWASSVPVLVEAPAGVTFTSVSTGWRHACALATDGSAYCWGGNHVGQVGNPTNAECVDQWAYMPESDPRCHRPVPTLVSGGHRFSQVVAGGDFSCGLDTLGAIYCWGVNNMGQLGSDTPAYAPDCHPNYYRCSSTPLRIPAPEAFTAVSGSGFHACGVTQSGGIYCWGAGNQGELGNGDDVSDYPVGVIAPAGVSFSTVHAAWSSTCALSTAGKLYCWGDNRDGQVGASTSDFCGGWSGAGGTFKGHPCATTPVPVAGDLSFTSLATYYRRNCALTSGGEAYCWGLGTGATPTRVGGSMLFTHFTMGGTGNDVQSFFYCGIAVDPKNTAYCWGEGSDGQLGNGYWSDSSSPVAVSTPPSP